MDDARGFSFARGLSEYYIFLLFSKPLLQLKKTADPGGCSTQPNLATRNSFKSITSTPRTSFLRAKNDNMYYGNENFKKNAFLITKSQTFYKLKELINI